MRGVVIGPSHAHCVPLLHAVLACCVLPPKAERIQTKIKKMNFDINDKIVCVDDRQTASSGFTSADYVFPNGMVVEGESYVVCGFVDYSHAGNRTGLLLTGKPMHAASGNQRCPGWNPARFRLQHKATKAQVFVCSQAQ